MSTPPQPTQSLPCSPAIARAASAATPLASQVAGHDGVMADASGALVIKPASAAEINFYQHVVNDESFVALRPFLPRFYGTLRLEGQQDANGKIQPIPGQDEAPESIVIENLTRRFRRPCVLDIKLGTVLADVDATPEKAARMAAKAARSTTGSVGLRLTGARTWHAPSESYMATTRPYGYALTPDTLWKGMVRVFPMPDDDVVDLEEREKRAQEEEKVEETGKGKGREKVEDVLADPRPEDKVYRDHATPSAHTAQVLAQLEPEIDRIAGILSQVELRAVGMSLLVVHEGDPDRLAVSLTAPPPPSREPLVAATDSDSSGSFELSSSEPSDSDDASPSRPRRPGPALLVRLIDFAHTRLTPGLGPDKGVLLGLETLRKLIAGRREAVQRALQASASEAEPTAPA